MLGDRRRGRRRLRAGSRTPHRKPSSRPGRPTTRPNRPARSSTSASSTWGQGDRERAAALLSEALAVQRAAGDLAYGAAGCARLPRPDRLRAGRPRAVGRAAAGEPRRSTWSWAPARTSRSTWPAWRCWPCAARAGRCRRRASSRRRRRCARQIGNPFKLPERAVFERATAAARAALGDAAFAAAWTEGRALSLERAVAEALAVDPIGEPGGGRRAPAPRAAPPLPAGLSPRELEVLRAARRPAAPTGRSPTRSSSAPGPSRPTSPTSSPSSA